MQNQEETIMSRETRQKQSADPRCFGGRALETQSPPEKKQLHEEQPLAYS